MRIRWVWWTVAMLLGLALWVLVAAYPVTAWSATAKQRVGVVELDAEIAGFMAARGYGTPDLGVTVASPGWFAKNTRFVKGYPSDGYERVGAATPAGSVISSSVLSWLGDNDGFPELVSLLVHERAHQAGMYDRPATDVGNWLEEGITDAVARDVTPMFLRALYPGRVLWWFDAAGAYDRGVAMVRTCSARLTGRPWFSGKAREWRRYVWRSGWDVRLDALRRCGVGV